MAIITTYNTLQDEVGAKLDRSAYQSGGANAAKTEGWIDLCEAQMNRQIRERQMLTTTNLSVSSETTALPSNFGGLVSLQFNDTSTKPLRYYPPNAFEQRSLTNQNGKPKFFTIQNETIRVTPIPDTTYTMPLVYYLRIPALSDSSTTNWMLDENPDAYLYGTLYHGMIELEYTADKIAGVKALYDDAMGELFMMNIFNQYPPGLLRMNKEFAGP